MTVIVTRQGKILRFIQGNEEIIKLNTPEGCVALDDPPNQDYYFDFKVGMWIAIPQAPNNHSHYDYTTHVWVDKRTLEEVKDTKWEAIKLKRSKVEFAGFEFEGNIYDSDQVSQGRIMGAALAGVDQVWTLADNTTVNLTALQLQQLYAALQDHIAKVHERGRIARQLIYEAETRDQVEAVQL